MRTLLFSAAFTLLFSVSYAQTSVDTTLATYTKKHLYIPLSDTIHVPKSILPYYANITTFAKTDEAYLRDYYIPAGGVRDDTYVITIQLHHIATIKIRKAYDEDRSNVVYSNDDGPIKILMVRPKPPLNANPSGRDGDLVINKLSGKVSFNLYH